MNAGAFNGFNSGDFTLAVLKWMKGVQGRRGTVLERLLDNYQLKLPRVLNKTIDAFGSYG